ncbi:MAG: hypothetical protein V4563_14075 [Pseudomonadota bacterium]
MKNLLLTLALALLCGCLAQSIPQSKIKIAGAEFALPKDSKMGTLVIELPTTNGTIRFYATNCTFNNNVEVLNAATLHDVSLLNAAGDIAGKIIQAGAKGVSPVP